MDVVRSSAVRFLTQAAFRVVLYAMSFFEPNAASLIVISWHRLSLCCVVAVVAVVLRLRFRVRLYVSMISIAWRLHVSMFSLLRQLLPWFMSLCGDFCVGLCGHDTVAGIVFLSKSALAVLSNLSVANEILRHEKSCFATRQCAERKNRSSAQMFDMKTTSRSLEFRVP